MAADPASVATANRRRRSSTFVISITPFRADGALDETAFRAHLRRMAAAGVGVYVGGGGSGEGYTLDERETASVVEIAVDELHDSTPVRAMGVEPRTAAEMIQYVRMADSAGAEACQVYSLDPGHGHRPTPGEVEAYFTEILAAVASPCVISTHQSVGYRLRIPLLAELVGRFDHIIGINCTHRDDAYLAQVIDAVGDRVDVHVGGPAQALTNLALGGQGYLTSEANLAPTLCATVTAAHDRNDMTGVFDAYATVLRLSDALYGAGGIRATKAVLRHLGLPGGFVRRPQLDIADSTLTTLLDTVDRLHIATHEGW